MNIKLIEVLNKTINTLENNKVDYNWHLCESCNCGILAQQVLCTDKTNIKKYFYDAKSTGRTNFKDLRSPWQRESEYQYNCQITGLPINKIFEELFKLGLSKDNIHDLEDLSDKIIIDKMGYKPKFNNKTDLTNYLKAWVELLKEESPKVIIQEKIVYKLVEVDSKVKQLVKQELILN